MVAQSYEDILLQHMEVLITTKISFTQHKPRLK